MDAISLRYGWEPQNTPLIVHVVSPLMLNIVCHVRREDFPLYDNEIIDLSANLQCEVCHDVELEPHLQPLLPMDHLTESENTTDGTRLDVVVGSKEITLMFKFLILYVPS